MYQPTRIAVPARSLVRVLRKVKLEYPRPVNAQVTVEVTTLVT